MRTAAIVVFGILLGIPLVYVFVVPRDARHHMASTTTKAQIKQFELMFESYYQGWGSYPEQAEVGPITAEFLSRLRTADTGTPLYREEDCDFDESDAVTQPDGTVVYRPLNGLGQPFYCQSGTAMPAGYEIWSAGPDGLFGAAGSADPAAAQAPDSREDLSSDDIANWKRLY